MSRQTALQRIAQLRGYYAEHHVIPSYAELSQLWGYASKSSAATLVAQLKRDGVLDESPGRRLRPGPAFHGADATANGVGARSVRAASDSIDAAAARWAIDVPDRVADAYALTMRLVAVGDLIADSARREARPRGLKLGEVLVMDALRRLGPPYENSPARLKTIFLISFAGIGKRIDRLERLGYVERRINEHDRRGRLVRLTEAGLSAIRDSFRERYAEHILALLSLSDGERRQLASTLRRLQQALAASRGTGAA